MDFLTGMAYWGLIVLIIINTIIAVRMKIEIPKDEEEATEKETCRTG